MSTAQIKTSYFKPFVVSCAVHAIFLSPFFLIRKVNSHELKTILVSLSDTKSKVGPKLKTLHQETRHPKVSRLESGSTRESLSKPQGPSTDLLVADSPNQISRSSRLTQNASVVEVHKPQFIGRALSKGIEGEVVLDVKVGKSGKVTQARVRKSLGYGLDEESLNAIYKFRFEPARDADGNPIDDELTYRFKFKINESSS